MAARKDKDEKENGKNAERGAKPDKYSGHRLHPDTKKSILAIVFAGSAIILALAAFGKAGPAGDLIFKILQTLFGWGYFILPVTLVFAAIVFLLSERQKMVITTLLGSTLIILSVLGLIEIISAGRGGWLGLILGSLKIPFGEAAAIIVNIVVAVIAMLIATNMPIRIKRFKKDSAENGIASGKDIIIKTADDARATAGKSEEDKNKKAAGESDSAPQAEGYETASHLPGKQRKNPDQNMANYIPPPLSLLKSGSEKPTTGDLLANANIIKRTLDSFGLPVEMGEISVGPAVTRYTLKPAEGIKLSRITALNQDLALALAAHPIRIEAPIPGKSLVGIEVPNKAAALVRLGSLLTYPEFQKSGLLGFVLGRDVSGEPIMASIDKMPHLLVAGATGSGKSILIHSLLVSLLYKNSPTTLRLVLIDPKRVELSVYDGLPHLVSPVITESKKAMGVFRWAIEEMERRYDLLLAAGSRDIKSYNLNNSEYPLPYLLIVIDELADLMTAYGREVEGSIVRLAQMARATGLHLILSTQRPSVEIITGLIKANITSRVALQVASQVDSRTILDMSGAEKLLGHGDLLYISSELSKPKRIQGSYLTEEEVDKVADFIKKNNKPGMESNLLNFEKGANLAGEEGASFDEYLEDEEDELYDEAVRVVKEAKKASASLLQRRLKVGYARAARLLDLMEGNGLIGPGDGAKPREVFNDGTGE